MKVLMVNVMCGVTSTGRICTDIADVLDERGDQCRIVYGRGIVPEKAQKYAFKMTNDVSVRFHALASRIFDRSGFYSKSATKKLIHQIKAYDPDIIHLHNLHGYYLHVEVLFDYLKKCQKPIVWTLHDCWAFTGHCSHYSFAQCMKWQKQCHACPQKKDYPASIVFDRSKDNYIRKKNAFCGVPYMKIITPSVWLKNEVVKSFLAEYPVEAIGSGIDLSVFYPRKGTFRKTHMLEDKVVLLGVANVWSQRKGIERFIELSKKLDERYKIVLVGDIRGIALPDQILHIPRTHHIDELAEIYSTADYFLNLSYEETQGLTTVEALACGTPVIVYNKTAIPECVNDKCGIVLGNTNIETLIDVLHSRPIFEENDCLSQAAAYEKKACFEKYIQIYEEMSR